MYYYEVAPRQIIRPHSTVFTYASSQELSRGQVVQVEVGKKLYSGIVMHRVAKPDFDVKEISTVLESTPLPNPLLDLAEWISTYYKTHFALVLQTILPTGLQKQRRPLTHSASESLRDRTKKVFTNEQRRAFDQLRSTGPGSALLHGITGSGKTLIYIELAREALEQNKSVIILVPEIALTSQIVDEFSHHFDNLVVTHSKQTEAIRHSSWKKVLRATSPLVVIGPRSALFLPLANIGLIVVDEAHEPAFKQEQSPRYSALRAASILGKAHNARVIFGSATPPVADYYLATHTNRPIVHLNKPARHNAVAPSLIVVDMTKRQNFTRHRFLSDSLLTSLEEALATDHQALIFHNRRGSASVTLCESCGWQAICPHCFIPFTLHADSHQLRCHICGQTDTVPTHCPECNSVDILHKGIGTKLVESELRRLFPNKKIARFDGDTLEGESIEKEYAKLYRGEIDIIIGTQVVAKGFDLPKLRTVGIVQADAGLSLPDYSASERTFQLLAQVVGRVGRSHHPTNVIVQSYQPTHPAVTTGLAQDYSAFYAHALTERKRGNFPPFSYLLKLTCVYKTEQTAVKNARKLALQLRNQLAPHIEILGPTPAFYERQHATYRWQLTLKSPVRQDLMKAIALLPPQHWQFEFDPSTLL